MSAARRCDARAGPLPRFAASCAPLLLAGAAIGNATGGAGATAPTIVSVGDGPAGVATGFSVSPGRVVTVAHIVDGGAIAVRGADGIARRGVVVRRDDTLDLALLAVPGLRSAPSFPRAGTHLLVRRDGAVTSLPARVARRITARIGIARRPALELAATAAAGDSGAPVLSGGRLTGIVFARSRERAGVAYAVDAGVLSRFLR